MSDFLQPRSLAQALEERAAHLEYQLLAGGTDLLVASKDRLPLLGMIDLMSVSELSGIEEVAGGGLRIGATTSYSKILDSEAIATRFALLHKACREIGAAQIQARGTLGGNIATSSPVGDSLPALMALDAQLELASTRGKRTVPYREFLRGYRKVDMAEDELIVAILLPAQPEGAFHYWRKVGTRRAQSISKLMIAAVGSVQDGKIASAKISLGAVADRTIRLYEVEKAIVGQKPGPETAAIAKEVVRASITPIDDLRSNAEYRLSTAENLVARFVLGLASTVGTTQSPSSAKKNK
ncbi:MAG: xanthine dehydrogenase family protein subunit M [Kofleriaceae bacterium]|nr:xanthine dehydrogenase family protein subunit M [Kofleriaceae bacterium]